MKPMKEYKLEEGFNIRLFVIILSVCLLVAYGLFNARNLIFGPSIEIWSPVTKELNTNENIITIKGNVKNATFLRVNGRAMTVDVDGNFSEKLLLTPGFNVINIQAVDRFKKEEGETIKIFYEPKIVSKESTETEEIASKEISKKENSLNRAN
jgi:hypothetical protein